MPKLIESLRNWWETGYLNPSQQPKERSKVSETQNPLLTHEGLMNMLRGRGVKFEETGFVGEETIHLLLSIMVNFVHEGWYTTLSSTDKRKVTDLMQEIMNRANN